MQLLKNLESQEIKTLTKLSKHYQTDLMTLCRMITNSDLEELALLEYENVTSRVSS
jgi:hypothetical protein